MPGPETASIFAPTERPDYEGACIANVVPALVGGGDRDGGVPPWMPESVGHARQVVLLVVDGLGWEQLRARPGLTPTLSGPRPSTSPSTSVAPTTTRLRAP